ncbi:VanZ family protein [Flavobacterium sp.]|uniref:VanZ family protein n=1 Tax=Flavobacterium sp. TaxID=239 RepID=UPI0026141E9E|nr:VanZ family protein [Flavobacterium sp.]MDG2433193.1 VanZ family protein [Flavobacterium sp.]
MRKNSALFAAVLWTSVIFFLCLIKSSDLPYVAINNLDKVVHASFHLLFVVLWFLYFNELFSKSFSTKALVFAFSLSVFYGIAIEIMQTIFTTTRSADVFDVVANLIGAIIGILLLIIGKKILNRRVV